MQFVDLVFINHLDMVYSKLWRFDNQLLELSMSG